MGIEVRAAMTLDDLDVHFESRHPDLMPSAHYWPHDEPERETYYSIRFGPDFTVFLTPEQAHALQESLGRVRSIEIAGE
jgi:hypothetical protein